MKLPFAAVSNHALMLSLIQGWVSGSPALAESKMVCRNLCCMLMRRCNHSSMCLSADCGLVVASKEHVLQVIVLGKFL